MQDDQYTLIREDGIDETVHPYSLVYHDRSFFGKKDTKDT